ncbi:MAG: PHP domain-containing protein, partial [Propionibacteriaceae bacterium]|nr:PHP domain-containing protein [Propionibacteriaceae bacterium]
MKIDLHTHSIFSDGTDSIAELIHKARTAELNVIALTDHDSMTGINQAQALGKIAGMTVLRGMELSTHFDSDGKEVSVHLLAYGCNPEDPELEYTVETLCETRSSRVMRILGLLDNLGMPMDLWEVAAQSTNSVCVGRPHIADAMVIRGYVVDRDEAFQGYLNDEGPAYVRKYSPTLNQAIDIVNTAKGVPILAHPWGRGNKSVITEEVIADLATNHGLFGIEVDHVEHSAKDRQVLRGLA